MPIYWACYFSFERCWIWWFFSGSPALAGGLPALEQPCWEHKAQWLQSRQPCWSPGMGMFKGQGAQLGTTPGSVAGRMEAPRIPAGARSLLICTVEEWEHVNFKILPGSVTPAQCIASLFGRHRSWQPLLLLSDSGKFISLPTLLRCSPTQTKSNFIKMKSAMK